MKIKRTLNASLMIAAMSLAVISCDLVDLEEPGPTAPVDAPAGIPATEAALLGELAGEVSRTWSALTFELEGLSGFQICRLDDTFTFFADGTYRYDGGEVLCGGDDDQQIKTGIWELDFGNLQIVFDEGTSIEYRATIAGLEDSRIQLNGQVDIFGNLMDIEGIYETTN